MFGRMSRSEALLDTIVTPGSSGSHTANSNQSTDAVTNSGMVINTRLTVSTARATRVPFRRALHTPTTIANGKAIRLATVANASELRRRGLTMSTTDLPRLIENPRSPRSKPLAQSMSRCDTGAFKPLAARH